MRYLGHISIYLFQNGIYFYQKFKFKQHAICLFAKPGSTTQLGSNTGSMDLACSLKSSRKTYRERGLYFIIELLPKPHLLFKKCCT